MYFLPAVLLVYICVPKALKNLVLLAASLLFYAWGEPVYVVLMILSIAVNYGFGRLLDAGRVSGMAQSLRRRHLWLCVAFNLLILFYFKYCNMMVNGINLLFKTSIPKHSLSLPIGISFYTFQALSYVVDVYKEKAPVQKNPLDFALYITMFPQLIAGPIVRYTDIAGQLKERSITLTGFGIGAEYFIKGLAKKVLLANTLGAVFTNLCALNGTSLSALGAWLGAVCYSLQLYFDFAGYSDMAIGLGRMFGFTFPKNFDYPYIAKSVTDFWRRWHISLSSWFREYVYIPLGGNRVSVGKHIRNLLIVWTLTGLWHGASLNFLLWGLYYGLWLILEKYVLADFLKRHPVFGHIYTIFIFVMGWVLFAFTDFSALRSYLFAMLGLQSGLVNGAALYYLYTTLPLLAVGILCSTPLPYSLFFKLEQKNRYLAVLLNVFLLLLSLSYLVYESYNPFLYFRF
jgi:alginate O-acetyltransferase complex protein AlgI